MAFRLPTLAPHQQAAHDFIVDNPHCGIFLGIAAGKCLTTLSALARIRPTGHILVVASLSIARSTWLDEINDWDFPLRTKSLIVDENDKQITRDQRLELFEQVHTDPPTMYFINRELLTQPSRPVTTLVPTGAAIPQGVSNEALHLLDLLVSTGGLTSEKLLEAHRARAVADGFKPLAKTRVRKHATELVSAGLATWDRRDCTSCGGKGCRECRFGLIDQMPVKTVNGRKVIQWPFPTVIIDESQAFKDPTSGRFKALAKVRPAILRLIELTGTPAPQSLLDLWSQMYLLDQGATLGRYTQYRAKYFTPTMYVDNRPTKWEILPGAADEIHKVIAPYVMSAVNTTIPMPPVTISHVNITLPKPAMDAYREFSREKVLELAIPDPRNPRRLTITADNAAILHGKQVQFASGTMYVDDSHNHVVIHTEKMEMLDHLISNASGPVLVAYRFVSELTEIMKNLAARGHRVEKFDGSRDMVRRWNARQIPVMVVHPASAGAGLNLQHGGSDLVWYTLPDSLEHYQQLNGRLVRPGQPNPVSIQCLVTKGTKDATIPGSLDRKDKVQKGLLSAVQVSTDDFASVIEDINDILGDLDINPL